MADDIIDSFFDDELDDDLPVVVGGQRGHLKGGQVLVGDDDKSKEENKKEEAEEAKAEASSAATSDSEAVEPAGDLDLEAQFAEDAKEIEQAKQEELSEKIDVSELQDVDRLLRDLTAEAEKACGVQFADAPDMQKRFHLTVEAFFKDLRDALETKSKLTMPTVSGGMGLSDEQAEQVMKTLQVKRGEYEAAFTDRTKKDRQKFVAAAADQQLHEQDQQAVKEKHELDKRFQELTGETAPAASPAQPGQAKPSKPTKVVAVQGKKRTDAPAAPAKSPHVNENDLAEALKNLISEDKKPSSSKEGESLPTYAAPAPKKSVSEPAVLPPKPGEPPPNLPIAKEEKPLSAPEPKPEPEKDTLEGYSLPAFKTEEKNKPVAPVAAPAAPKPAPKPVPPAPKPAPVPPAPKPAPMPPVSPTPTSASTPTAPSKPGKPVVSDVKPTARKLVGPVEELRSLTLKDFRRLSKEPKEATLKIKDKIDLLGDEQSFEVKTLGMKAWRESTLNKLYLEILRRSLEGQPISKVIADMEEKGEETLTKPEFDAIMKMNREIRFG